MFENNPLVKLANSVKLPSKCQRPKEVVIASNDSLSQLLKDIYQFDENGVLNTDLSTFLSDKVDPRVADYIRQNLLRVQTAQSSRPDMTDDELQALCPTSYDTVESYQSRVRDYLDSLKAEKPSE